MICEIECDCSKCRQHRQEVAYTEAMHKLNTEQRIAVTKYHRNQQFWNVWFGAGLGAIIILAFIALLVVV